jgi:hypothetical protein
MYLFCPRCNTQHLASSRCPRCSSRLLAPAEASDLLLTQRAGPPPPPPTTPGFGGRIVVGTLVALGLHLAFQEWVSAAAGAAGVTELGGGLWVGYALRVVGAVVGGVLAGAGRSRSFATGAFVGATCGVAWLAVDAYPDVTFDPIRLAAAGALLLLGGVAAVVGGVVWPPPVEVKPPEASHNSSLFKLKADDGKRRRGKPVAWVRATVAVSVAVMGVLGADYIRQGLTKMPKGTFNNLTMTARTDAILAGFVGVVAGVVAGATSTRGWREGAIAGVGAALAVVGISTALPDGPPLPVQYVVDQAGVEANAGGLALAGLVLFVIVTAGGWFGGQLMPALRKRQRLGGGL